MLEPNQTKNLFPKTCSCGHSSWEPASKTPYYTHQHIELPKIELDVMHLVLHKGTCACCGETVKATVPNQFSSGYGPRLSSVICELSGSHGASRQTVQDFCHSVLGLSISTGGIQRVIDRMSTAIEPIDDEIGHQARRQEVNGIDETSWFKWWPT